MRTLAFRTIGGIFHIRRYGCLRDGTHRRSDTTNICTARHPGNGRRTWRAYRGRAAASLSVLVVLLMMPIILPGMPSPVKDGPAMSSAGTWPRMPGDGCPRAAGPHGRTPISGRASDSAVGIPSIPATPAPVPGAVQAVTGVAVPHRTIGIIDTTMADTTEHPESTDRGCAVWDWPVRGSDGTVRRTVLHGADIPAKNWQKGHRGVDLPVGDGGRLVSPADGRIAFAGKVAGKDVMTIRTDEGLLASLEPATTDLRPPMAVRRGQEIGTPSGVSDHCGSGCVHLGVREADRYIDPSLLLFGRTIRLKPVGRTVLQVPLRSPRRPR